MDSAATPMSTPANEVITALGRAQSAMPVVGFDAVNPHFRNRYATLAHVLATVRPVLAANGLTLTQVGTSSGTLITLVAHTSGQWISSELPIIADKQGPQPFGSAMSYARRYGVCAILGIAPEEDDDGQGATQRAPYQPKPAAPEKPLPRQRKDLPPVPENPNAFTPPEWWEEKLGFGKHASQSWREMSEGEVAGQRNRYVAWLVNQPADTPAQQEIKRRAAVVNKLYLAREADAF